VSAPPTAHLAAAYGEIAENVLLPGDPRRARLIAEHFLSDVVVYSEVRNMTGLTGLYRGRRVSVQGTGMGIPSIAIYAAELFKFYGVKAAIRVGSSGSMQPSVGLRDIVIATGAHTDSAFNRRMSHGIDYAPCADFDLAVAARSLAVSRSLPHHVGTVYSCDRFYDGATDDPGVAMLVSHGALCVEMEAAGLYSVAALHGARALCLTTVTDGVSDAVDLTADERESQLLQMAELALDTLHDAA
jgi:purine-nucleoside phosphorylase